MNAAEKVPFFFGVAADSDATRIMVNPSIEVYVKFASSL
jgi:hypothetical protein